MPRRAVWFSALGIGLFQVVGSFGAADNQPERRPLGVLAVVLVLLGPLALARRDRWPLVAAAVSIGAAVLYVGLGYPCGPIFLSPVVALFTTVQAGHRRAAWTLATLGYIAYLVASALDPRSTGVGAAHLALVAGWLALVLAVSEVVRIRRDQLVERRRTLADERQRKVGEQRLELAQELHDVLAPNISLINVQASVALHLLDEQPEQTRPALANIEEASREALRELRACGPVVCRLMRTFRRAKQRQLCPRPSRLRLTASCRSP